MDFEDLLKSTLGELGVNLSVTTSELATLVREQSAKLALAQGEPGFEEVLVAARDNIALKAGLALHEQARGADQRIIGLIHGALGVGASLQS